MTNLNSFAIEVAWQLYGTDQTGSLTAQPGENYFDTQTVAGPNTTVIRWMDHNAITRSTMKASGGTQCFNDADGDGIADSSDTCPDTPMGEAADPYGCSCSQRDGDNDKVSDCIDTCPDSVPGATVDATGCVPAVLDADGDGVNDAADTCPGTAFGQSVDSNGCSCAQLDKDGDGLSDCNDLCPDTPAGATVDASGCSCAQLDKDGDGIANCTDRCPDTLAGTTVDADGCSCAQLDKDGDGLSDCNDLCPDTPAGATVDANGCSCTQLDEDRDGVADCDDSCPRTPGGVQVDVTGCALMMVTAGPDLTLYDVSPVGLGVSVTGGTPPYSYWWSAAGWAGSSLQSPIVLPDKTTVYTVTVSDWSFPPKVVSDTITITIVPRQGLSYTITNLGSIGTKNSYANGLNNLGQVVGYYYTDSWLKRAFLYANGAMIDLGTLGGTESTASAVNDGGQVVGQSRTAGGAWHAFLWDAVQGMRDLGTLGGASSEAYAINAEGRVAGFSAAAGGNRAFIYSNGVMTAVNGTEAFAQSGAFDINDSGHAVGVLLGTSGASTVFKYTDTLVNLGSPLLTSSQAWLINNNGVIAGHSWGAGEYRSFVSYESKFIDLGLMTGFSKLYAWGLSDSGQVVGSMTNASGTANAFIYTGGQLMNLNTLLAPGHGWEFLTTANGINDRGQIAGYGKINGVYRAFLLNPTP